MKTPLSHILLVLVASFIGSFGAVFLKAGAQELRKGWLHVFNWRLAAGVGLFVISSIFYIIGLRPPGELSVLYPMVALGYIWTLLWSRLFFKEPFTREKFVGLFLVLAGVFFVGLGSR
jgi:multidrug transporter EmrE-like cation transporter